MIISNIALRNRISVAVLMVLITLGGAFSYITLPRESAPDVPIPLVLVTTTYEGVSPADVETAVTMKIERKLTGIKGVKEVRSTSAEGMSMITVEFMPDLRIEDALQYVRDKVDQAKSELPTDAKDPTIHEINVSEMPIMTINIAGDVSPVVLKEIADQLEDHIEQIPGVLDVDVMGGLEREIRLEFDPDRLASYALTIPEILALIPSENVNISAGGLQTPGTRFNVRVPAEFQQPEEIDHLQVAQRMGKPVYLTDLATIADTFKDRDNYARLTGADGVSHDSVSVSVRKRVGANILHISEGVSRVLDEARRRAPSGVRFEMTLDRSQDIRRMVADLENNMFAAFSLVVIILLAFMGWRSSLIVAAIVPLSMLLSFSIIQMLGYTLNMIVLFGLVLAVGMLVDNGIVIVENIYRHMQLGYSRLDAAMKGTSEVAWPVITSTLTTVAAFVPMLFWPGTIGNFMKYLPITLIVVLMSSMLVALVVSPVLCVIFAGKVPLKTARSLPLRLYEGFLRLSLRHRFTTLALSVILLIALAVIYGRLGHGVEFFPSMDPKNAVINIRGPQGMNIHESDRLARLVEQRVARARHAPGDIEYVMANVGSSGSSSPAAALFGSGGSGPHVGNITLGFPDYELRERAGADVLREIRQYTDDIAGAEVKVEKQKDGPPTGAAITVRIAGEDFATLGRLSEQARRQIQDVPGMLNLRSDLEATRPELAFRVDRRRAVLLGVNTALVGNFLKTAIFGTKVGTYRQFNDEYDITIRLPEASRTNVEDLFRLHVPNNLGRAVPLSSLGSFEYVGGFGTINRVNQKRVVTLTADADEKARDNPTGRVPNDVLQDVMDRLHPVGPASFQGTDILDWPALLAELDQPATVAGRRMRSLLPGVHQENIRQARAALPNLSDRRRNEVVAALNSLLGRIDLYQPAAFAQADAAAIGPLLDEGRRGLKGLGGTISRMSHQVPYPPLEHQEIRRANRLAIESALPGVLASRQPMPLPADYAITYAGEKEEQDKASAFLLKAFAIACLLIVLILVAQFNTLLVPAIIMSTVVLSLIGVLLGLIVHQMPFVIIMTGIGVISLAGVVVNNAIVLLNFVRQLQRQGKGLVEAAVEAGVTRLRPVLLTAGSTVIALLPTALGQGFDVHTFQYITRSDSSQWWQNFAVAVIYGLSFATVLTLVVVPTLYVSLYRLAAKLGLGGLKHAEAAGEAKAEPVAATAGQETGTATA